MGHRARLKRRRLLDTAGLGLGFLVLGGVTGLLMGVVGGIGIAAVFDRNDVKDFMLNGGVAGACTGGLICAGGLLSGKVRRKLIITSQPVRKALTRIGVGSAVVLVSFWSVANLGLGDYLDNEVPGGQAALVVLVGISGALVVGLGLGLLALIIVVGGRVTAGLLHGAVTHLRSEPAPRDGVTPRDLSIRAAAAFLPARARHRWLDDITEALYDYPRDQHRLLKRNFLLHAPSVIAESWAIEVRHLALTASRRR